MIENMTELDGLMTKILHQRSRLEATRSLLVAVSGIDGSGKGYVTEKLVAGINEHGLHGMAINIDPWLTPPEQRFNPENPAAHFYNHAFVFEELFQRLIYPLQQNRSIYLQTTLTGQLGIPFTQTYDVQQVDVIVLEGIFLLKQSLRQTYDLAFWIECSFETALERALMRNQEDLSPEQIIEDYRTIYFPAQKLHFAIDAPQSQADAIYVNDPRLAPS